MEKYNIKWGQGALVFAFGFCERLNVNGALLLDAHPLDLDELYLDMQQDLNVAQKEHWFETQQAGTVSP